jgi:gluconate 2-dehydrogenase gamma chain
MSGSLGRRRVLLSSVALFSLVAGLRPSRARSLAHEIPWMPGAADAPQPFVEGGYRFFTPAEASFMDAIVARLIPADDLGPGAREAGVTVFLDRQLAGPYGRAEAWYMEGPWKEGAKSQGYQSRLTPAQLYRTAIRHIDEHCRKELGGKSFSGLSPEQQDQVITDLEKGKLKIPDLGPHSLEIEGAKSDSFFAVVMQHTIEGFFSDPLYGGNKDMAGWKLIGFPGARYDYRPYVSRHGEKLGLAPVGIMGRPGWKSAEE